MANDTATSAPERAAAAAPPMRSRPDAREIIVKYGFIVVTILFFVYFSATLDAFFRSSTIFSLLKFTSVVAIGDGMPTDVRGALSEGLDLLYISAGIHARDYMTGDVTDERALADFLASHQADPHWWMPRLA